MNCSQINALLLRTVDVTSSVRRGWGGVGGGERLKKKKERVMEEQVSQCLVSKWLFI